MTKLGIINYGSGNFRSVFNAYEALGLGPIEIAHADQLDRVSHIVLPGVGAFGPTMDKLTQLGFVSALHKHVLEKKKPYLGICVGMQILADVGTEFADHAGLGFISGRVEKLPVEILNLSLPHIGWNEVKCHSDNPLFSSIDDKACFYFVHSYYFHAISANHVIASCRYGINFPCCIQHENIWGVQFHPEKSQTAGLQLLRNFYHV